MKLVYIIRMFIMLPIVFVLFLILSPIGIAVAEMGHNHVVPTLQGKTSSLSIEENIATITFGPINLPTGHSGDLAASLPKLFFNMPEDRYLIGYKSEIFTRDGRPLPGEYLHHLLLLDMDQKSISCPGEPLFFAGAGMEMTKTQFPKGYGVKLQKAHKLMALVAFYHKAPPTKDAMARFTMYMAPKGTKVESMEVYQVGVNVVCFSKFSERPKNQTDEGIEINPGVQVMTSSLNFLVDGCVKYAYPHGHNGVLLVALENKTTNRTLLRTVPEVEQDGDLKSFPDHQVYADVNGFSVNTKDDYEMILVHHRPLQQKGKAFGMGNYLLYMTPGKCPNSSS